MQRFFPALLLCPVIITVAQAQSTLPDDPSASPIVCTFPSPQVVSIRYATVEDIALDTAVTTGGVNCTLWRTPHESLLDFDPFQGYGVRGDQTYQDVEESENIEEPENVEEPEAVACIGIAVLPSGFTCEWDDDFRGAVDFARRRERIDDDAFHTGPAASSVDAAGSGPDIR